MQVRHATQELGACSDSWSNFPVTFARGTQEPLVTGNATRRRRRRINTTLPAICFAVTFVSTSQALVLTVRTFFPGISTTCFPITGSWPLICFAIQGPIISTNRPFLLLFGHQSCWKLELADTCPLEPTPLRRKAGMQGAEELLGQGHGIAKDNERA